MRITLAILLSLTIFYSCLSDEAFKTTYSGFEPTNTGDEWSISSPDNEGVDKEKIEQAYNLLYNDQRFHMARSLLVIRNGKLIAEAYPNNVSDRDEYANIQSCTKTITSIMLGIAIQNGIDISVEDKLFSIYPNLFDDDTKKHNISVEDALTMQTGLQFSNDKNTLQLYQTKTNSTSFVLSFPYIGLPGTFMNYNDGAPQLISKAIEVKTGKTLSVYANETLFQQLNITDWKWEHAKDGTTFGAFSLYLKPRDFAKIGLLLLQNGRWHNCQIIDANYLSAATSIHTTTQNKPYGYYFWIYEKNSGFYAHGHGGQILLVVPEKNLVMLYTAWPYTSSSYFDDAFDLFEIIIDGCR